MAAQATHITGIIQNPNMKNGSSTKLKQTVQRTIYIGIFTCHIPLIIDWNITNVKTNMIPMNDTLMKLRASENTVGTTHMRFSKRGAII